MPKSPLSSYDKALRINLDKSIYGTFAEIGAGQEVANWFFRASASAGTVAKSISAYDMTMSDAIYGKANRYVSRDRLKSMLDYEFKLVNERLSPATGKETTYFAFCNTVRARGYQDTGECHGWMGIRFQQTPLSEPSEILIHLRLLDRENVDQMEALGILGLNLVHAAFHQRDDLEKFTQALVDNIDDYRVEIDMLKFHGAGFEEIDNRLCALQLVQSKLTTAAMFLPDGEVVQPAEALYNKPILLLRGSFDPVTNLHLEMIQRSREDYRESIEEEKRDQIIELCEISMANLLRDECEESCSAVDHLDFLNRVDALQALGKTVIISRCPEFHRLIGVLSRYSRQPVGILLSIGLLNELFKEKWSANLDGGVLESFGRLFKNNSQLFVAPWWNKAKKELVTSDNFLAPDKFQHLFNHLRENGSINPINIGEDERSLLEYTGRHLQEMLNKGDNTWKEHVPEAAHPFFTL